jgi:NADH dehydrogenase
MENVKKNAIPMKTLNDAIEMRNTILKKKAAICKDIESVVNYLTFIAGGGPTEEVSVAYAGMKMQHVITDNFRRRQP